MRSLLHLIPASVLGAIVCEITLIVSAYTVAAFLHSDIDPTVWLMYENGWPRIALMVVGILLGLYLQDMYDNLRSPSKVMLLQQICLVFGFAFLFQAVLSYLRPELVLPRWMMMTGSLFLLVALPLWRMALSGAITGNLAAERVLFVGSSPASVQVAHQINQRPEYGLAVAGFLEDTELNEEASGEGPLLGPLGNIKRVVEEQNVSRIVVGLRESRQQMPVSQLLDLGFGGIKIEEAATTFEYVFRRVCTEQIRPSQLIFTTRLGPSELMVRAQSMYSWVIALAGVLITLPVMVLAAILVKLTSPGPALYQQRRVGLNGRIFTIYKFRSMRADAEAKTGAVWAVRNDPRVTTLGRFLRKSRIDELPQLFNVLRGEMSIVGPRPERPEFVATLSEQIPFYRQRHVVRPGITGWAQINHKYGDTIEDTVKKLEYDLYYIKSLSPGLDFLVMFHTVKVMLLSRGAQ
ncbi:MAG: sugar transferase [Bryobacterales bacterium]|nr:sugar transferase [Bryobacterales bacterium]